ncbi:hypothetical protein Tco_0012619 [Tanacetum coccineum]
MWLLGGQVMDLGVVTAWRLKGDFMEVLEVVLDTWLIDDEGNIDNEGITSYGYCLKIISSGWSFAPAVLVVVIAIVGVVIVVVFGIVVVVVPLVPVFLLVLSVFAIDAACAFRAEEMPSLISYWMAAKVMAGVSDVDVLLGGILSTKDNT